MSTRGFICFVINGSEKTAYNHGGSRPEELGLDILTWLRSAAASLATLQVQVADLRVVAYDSKPSSSDIARLAKYARPSSTLDSWGDLVSGTEGDPALVLGAGVITDWSSFPADSLSAEWGYVVDLDEEVFEVYEGFQTRPHSSGRFAAMKPPAYHGSPTARRYYPVALRARWPLTALPDDAPFVNACISLPRPLVLETLDVAGCLRTTVAQFELDPDDLDSGSIAPADATALAADVARQVTSAADPAEALWRLGQELAADTDASPQDSVRRKAIGLMLYNLQVHTIGLTDLFPELQQGAADESGLAQRLDMVRDALLAWRHGDDKIALDQIRWDLHTGPDAALPGNERAMVDALYSAHHLACCQAGPAQVHTAARQLQIAFDDILGLSQA